MNEKAKNIFQNIRYTVSANFLVLAISMILNLVVPKFLGVSDYSYWQLYVFYSSYVGFFHFGWLDGIYLKTGGAEYDELDSKNLNAQFWLLIIFETIIASIFSIFVYINIHENYRMIILLLTAIVMIISNARTFVMYIFQSTNRIKEYAQVSRNDRYIYILLLLIYLIIGGRSFAVLIFFDVLSKLLVTLWGMYRLKDMLILKPIIDKTIVKDIIDNISIGSSLMLSNIANMLILGIARFFVERQWSIETFGKLSFTLSISNMFMTFINAVGIVMFPMLRRTNQEKLPELYVNLRNVFVPFTFFILLFFTPIRYVLELWLPDYKESLYFMGILFPMIVYEGRMSLLVNTYLKTLRKERAILFVNSMSLILTLVSTSYSVFVLKNITITVMFIMIALIFRCILAEEILSKTLQIPLIKKNIYEVVLVAVFIVNNLMLNQAVNFIVYLVSFVVYVVLNVKNARSSLHYLFDLVRNR